MSDLEDKLMWERDWNPIGLQNRDMPESMIPTCPACLQSMDMCECMKEGEEV